MFAGAALPPLLVLGRPSEGSGSWGSRDGRGLARRTLPVGLGSSGSF